MMSLSCKSSTSHPLRILAVIVERATEARENDQQRKMQKKDTNLLPGWFQVSMSFIFSFSAMRFFSGLNQGSFFNDKPWDFTFKMMLIRFGFMSPHQKKYRDQRDLGPRPSEGFDFGKHVELALVSQSIQVTIFDFDVS